MSNKVTDPLEMGASIIANVQDLSADEIRQLIEVSQKTLKERQEHGKNESLLTIVELVKRNHIPLNEIINTLNDSEAIYTVEGDNNQIKKMYIDSDNKLNTWAGSGRRPKWLVEKIKLGHDINEFVVSTANSNDITNPQTYYYNPNNRLERWNGYGRKPEWYKKEIAKGTDMQKYKTFF